MSEEPKGKQAAPDVVFIGGPSDDGAGAKVLRIRPDRIETGELRGVKEGAPILGELVKLSPRAEHGRAFDVEVLADGRPSAADPEGAVRGKGPPRVSSEEFRANWESIFGTVKQPDRSLN